MLNFNPRSREGSDGIGIPEDAKFLRISIHAPAKGATLEETLGYSRNTIISIHAPAKGATELETIGLDVDKISIHAPAKGATKVILKDSTTGQISIHAPAKGATAQSCTVYG